MWRVPSGVIAGPMVTAIPTVVTDRSFVALAAGGVFTSITFPTEFLPLFDVFVAMDQAGSLQPQARFATAAPGDTWRDSDNPFAIAAYAAGVTPAFRLTGYRSNNVMMRWVLTNTAGVPCTFTEIVILGRTL